MAGKGYSYMDDYDVDDWYDQDDDYDDDYEEDDPDLAEVAKAEAQKPAAKPAKNEKADASKPSKGLAAKQGTAANGLAKAALDAGASSLAHYLCSPPPTLPSGKPQKGGRKVEQQPPLQQTFPIAPHTLMAHAGESFRFEQPSPDDRVIAAQSGKLTPSQARGVQHVRSRPADAAPSEAAQASIEGEVQAMQLRDEDYDGRRDSRTTHNGDASTSGRPEPDPQPQRRRRPLSEYKPDSDLARALADASGQDGADKGGKTRLHLVVLGHVDAGKSTLMGRLLHELGHISQKMVHKAQRDATAAGKGSFAWAWLLDERSEERSRGVTVDVATTFFETPRHLVRLLDAPGHRDFVPNMIAGAAQADAALLLVDGSVGGFEAGFGAGGGSGGGQTREHAQLARSLGIEQLAVIVSKLDTCAFSQDRFEEVKGTLLPFLRTSGFRESQVQWLPAVGPSGQNLTGPPTEPALASWWRGPSVVAAIDAFRPTERAVGRPLRLPIADVFKGQRGGMAVSGKLEGGALKVGTKVLIQPGGHSATVRSVEVDGQAVALARAGDTVDVVLAGVDSSALAVGALVCHPEWPVPVAARMEARIVVLDLPMPILKGRQVSIHVHTAQESGQISRLISVLNPKTGEVTKARPRAIVKGQTAVVEISVARPMCVEQYTDYRALGRIALRDGGHTIAVGIIVLLHES
ncbi:HBS1-like protein [Coccomyxa sp. Obi]|nr:HBS1-like protein [Coccomyxa sp. Obi]